jgi:Flp pilus assembly protein TadD
MIAGLAEALVSNRSRWALATLRLALFFAIVLAPAEGSALLDKSERIDRAHTALLELRVEDAAAELEPLLAENERDPDVAYLGALLAFHQGDYATAVRRIDASLAARAPVANDARPAMADLIRATREATAAFVTRKSADGRYVVQVAPGPDEILVPYALDAMARADRALERLLGYRMPGPVRLEIYGSPSQLAQVSTLTVEAIERTGTIALCKWDRLMVTTPRALHRGYPWVDTIGHEYVHLVLTRASRDRAPVWFQEGVAKFLERTWRGDTPAARLPTPAATLLGRAVQQNTLLPFERFHPSIAMLPSQDDAALAFAQVSTFFETYCRTHGEEKLRQAVARIAEGADARDALAQVAGTTFAAIERAWRADLGQRQWPGTDGPVPLPLRFRSAEGADDVDDAQDVSVEAASRHLRLGDLLWARNRPQAAAAEYRSASRAAPEDPIVASRLARAALRSGDAQAAVAATREVLARYPDHAPAHALLASALRLSGDGAGAREAAREAIRLNPFDPSPHCDLSAVADDDAERDREADLCRRLGGAFGQ